jgi:hypothetical protein
VDPLLSPKTIDEKRLETPQLHLHSVGITRQQCKTSDTRNAFPHPAVRFWQARPREEGERGVESSKNMNESFLGYISAWEIRPAVQAREEQVLHIDLSQSWRRRWGEEEEGEGEKADIYMDGIGGCGLEIGSRNRQQKQAAETGSRNRQQVSVG